jgi:acyl dehydratase
MSLDTHDKQVTTPDFQTATITDEDVVKARELVGVWLRRDVHWPQITEPISQHDIRRWALYSVGDDNPLWTDAEYGKRSWWGRTIAPPTFLYAIDSSIAAPGLPGIQWIHGGSRWFNYRPVEVGDRITARARVIRVEEKFGRRVPRFIKQVGETLYVNQRNEVVSRIERDTLRIPRARSGQGFKDSANEDARQSPKYSEAEIEAIRLEYVSEYRRGSEILYWEDVTEGAALPSILKGPLTLVDIMAFYAGRRAVYNPLKLAFLERERHSKNVYVSPNTGIPTHPAAGHFDVDIAHEVGMARAYDQGWMRINWMGHLLTNWAGDAGFVRHLDVTLPALNMVGDLSRCHAKVVAKRVEDGEHLVDIECWAENQNGIKNTTGTAAVRLPSREPNDAYLF